MISICGFQGKASYIGSESSNQMHECFTFLGALGGVVSQEGKCKYFKYVGLVC